MFTVNSHLVKHSNSFIVSDIDPYNPLKLPSNTVRVRTNDGEPPIKVYRNTSYETATLVTGTSDVYDVYKSGTDFGHLLRDSTNVTEVLGANTTGITSTSFMFNNCSSLTSVSLFDTSKVTTMYCMFTGCSSLTSIPLFDTSKVTNMEEMLSNCSSLTSVPLFDTSKVTNMNDMFYQCSSLTSVPLFDTSNVTDMSYMFTRCFSLTSIPLFDTSKVTNMKFAFYNCDMVESGALALYQQASTQANPPVEHSRTFTNCGYSTTTGAAELAQIPRDWK